MCVEYNLHPRLHRAHWWPFAVQLHRHLLPQAIRGRVVDIGRCTSPREMRVFQHKGGQQGELRRVRAIDLVGPTTPFVVRIACFNKIRRNLHVGAAQQRDECSGSVCSRLPAR